MLQALKYSAHIKWFVDVPAPSHSYPKLSESLIIFLLVIIGLFALWMINSYMNKSGLNRQISLSLKNYVQFVTPLIRYLAVLILILNLVNSDLLSPNLAADGTIFSSIVFLNFCIIVILLSLGYRIKVAAVLLFFTYISFAINVSIVAALDHLEYAGMAGYLFLATADKWSLDYKFKKNNSDFDNFPNYALSFYRVSLGIGISILAFSEKLIDLSLSQEFLANYNWNFLSFMGLTNRNFIIMAGIVELLIGLSLILNWATRLTILVLLTVMILTAILLGQGEIIGHLFVVGVVFAIFVNQK
jgi:uncharacterized membrane protein YphA (DoxX/SURF4 family)